MAGIRITWLEDPEQIDSVATFFSSSIDPSYISHSELMFGRAISQREWSPTLLDVVKTEFHKRVPWQGGNTTKKIVVGYDGATLVAVALLDFHLNVPIPFAIIEDIAVSREFRDRGLGQRMLDWIFAEARLQRVARVFLESGLDNHAAHHFFERNGFKQVSIVMMTQLE